MITSAPFRICAPLLVLLSGMSGGWAGLSEYLAQPDTSFAWRLVAKSEPISATVYEIRLTSQTWQGIVWEHNLNVFVPVDPPPSVRAAARGSALLLIDGGSQGSLEKKPGRDALVYGSMLAQRIGVPCAVLRQVPNQPLLGALNEDALIAETLRRYVKSRDESWPLLFPMTKAAIRAMDALGEFSTRELGERIDKFVVTGASKRGWTTWLTAASDPRVVALVPMVIDMLNARPQMDHQLKVFGAWSDQTQDYHELLRRADSEEVGRLWELVDPFVWREKISQPKLIILGNNDPYWATDALNIYWDGLTGPKWIHYVPNAGHDLVPRAEGKRVPPMSAINTLGVFTRHQLTGQAMPKVEWKHDDLEGRPHLTITADPPPKSASLWIAHASTQDFRKATWQQRSGLASGPTINAEIELPSTGSTAFYAALLYEFEGVEFSLCTQVRIVDASSAGR